MFGERHLNFDKFLEQRAQQIGKFRDILKLQTKKKGHQALPKSIRRRAMSHNRYRIPSKMRKLFQQQLIKNQNMQKIPKCRKHIRKRSRLILSYKDRFSKIKWLSTHLWAARRMRMINYYGYKVAETPNQKVFRSAYRHFRHNCCLIDFSYYQCLTIKFLNGLILPNNILISQNINKVEQLLTTKTYEGSFLNNQNKFICPLIILKSRNQQIKCFFHPCALQQAKNVEFNHQKYNILIQKSKSQIYCLIGPEFANKTVDCLKIYGINIDEKQKQNIKYRNSSANYYFPQKESKSQKIPFISNPLDSMIKQSLNQIQMSQNIRNKTLLLFEKLIGESNRNKSIICQQYLNFWKFYNSLNDSETIKFNITNRSKYTHKRRNKLSKQNKKKVIDLQKKKRQLLMSSKSLIPQQEEESQSLQMISESLQLIKNQIKEIFIQDNKIMQNENNLIKGQKYYKVQPVLVSTFKYSNLYEGCLIFCSDNDNCRLWRIISKNNIKIIGLKELNHLKLQGQCLNFPADYPETQSFKKLCINQSLKQFQVFKRRPPQKRINFLTINSPNPFSSFQDKITQNFRKVFIEMVNKGRCFNKSYIYELNSEDISFIQKQLEQKGCIGIVVSQRSKNKFISDKKDKKIFFDYSKQGYEKLTQILSNINVKRQLMGRITTGGYLYSKSIQGGIGYVNRKIGSKVDEIQNQGYVLIRKVSSPHYYLGMITKIY